MAQIVSPISGKTVDSFNIDEVMGMLAADLVVLIAGADISFRYPELERAYGEYGAMIKEGRVPPAEGRSVNAQTTQLCTPAYFELDSRVYDNWLESVYPSEVRRVDITKIVTDQQSYDDLLRRTAERNIEGYRHEVNVAIDRAFVKNDDSNSENPAFLIGYDGGGERVGGALSENSPALKARYEVLAADGTITEGGLTPTTFRAVWSEILAVYFDMLCENNTYTEGDNVYGARREDLVVYVPHKFLAYSDMSYIQRLFNERGLEKLPEIKTHNGAPVNSFGSETAMQAIFIMDKRVLNHVARFMEAGSHDVDCRKSTVFDLHVEHMLKYAPFYKAYCILTPMPTAD